MRSPLHDPFSDTLHQINHDGSVTVAHDKILMRLSSEIETAIMSGIGVRSPASIMSLQEWTFSLGHLGPRLVQRIAQVITLRLGIETLTASDDAAHEYARYAVESASRGSTNPPASADIDTLTGAIEVLFSTLNEGISRHAPTA